MKLRCCLRNDRPLRLETSMEKLHISLGERSYPILIGPGLLSAADVLCEHIKARDLLIVTNDRVAPLYLERLKSSLASKRTAAVVLPDGESYKTLATVSTVFDALTAERMNRDAGIVALGGGVVGDIAGFAAACYQRGIDYVQVPTTLLAQVDSSVGGKTGVNHPAGKNLIGAFHQPRCVITDPDTLQTLPEREYRSGLAEVIKYGLIRDPAFFNWLEAHPNELLARDADALSFAIRRSCELKAEIVGIDEREQGLRAILNLGHTFGHAIEAATGYGNWLHGEAVAAGMVLAADFSRRLGWLSDHDFQRTVALLKRLELPVGAPAIGARRALELMGMDKKVLAGKLRLVLMKSLGDAVVTSDFPLTTLNETLEQGFS
jgi:3-dehydroquinate synthase